MRRLAAILCFALLAATVVASASLSRPVPPPDREVSEPGRRIFEPPCPLCRTPCEHPGQGPGLGVIVVRKTASMPFGYSPAMRGAHLTWDRATFDRFLAAPAALVPGTTMPVAIADEGERRAVVDYLASLTNEAPGKKPSSAAEAFMLTPPAPPGLRTGPAAFGDYRGDGPGVRRHITIADLPAPYATPSALNGPDVVTPPPGARPSVPPGFRVDVFAHDLLGPRLLRVSPSGALFVAESQAGRVHVLRAADGGLAAEKDAIFASGLDRPFGIAFYPPG